MMARPAVVCTWNGKLVGKTVLTNGLKGLDQQTVAIHISAADLDKVLGEDAKKGAIRLELELIDEAQPLKTACSASYVNITRAESFYTRRMVVEEGTGAWCGWCVKGIVGLRYMNATYPDQFIGIAVHNGDMYTVNNYNLAGEIFRRLSQLPRQPQRQGLHPRGRQPGAPPEGDGREGRVRHPVHGTVGRRHH